MRLGIRQELKDGGRIIVGGLLLGMPLLYTMETWWLAWRLPALVLFLYALLSLVAIMAIVHFVGFRPEEEEGKRRGWREWVNDFMALVLYSYVAAFAVLGLFGIIERDTPLHEAIRQATMQVVPLGFGAAIANRALGGGDGGAQTKLAKETAIGALGAIFFAMPVAVTEEMELIPAHAGWWRAILFGLAGVLVAHLALYELEFRGHEGRTGGKASRWLTWGETFVGFVMALAVAAALLAGFGQFVDVTWAEAVQKVVILSFLCSVGAAAGRVVV